MSLRPKSCDYQGHLSDYQNALDDPKIMKDTDIKTLYCYCDLSGSSKVKGHGAK